jgi:hypothetical protein
MKSQHTAPGFATRGGIDRAHWTLLAVFRAS